MADLNDILQGLINTDSSLISKLTDEVSQLQQKLTTTEQKLTTTEQKLTATEQSLTDKINRGSGSYAILDINTPDRGGSGSLKYDALASNGQCVTLVTSSSANYCLYSGTFSDVKYGHYAICARVRTNNLTSSSLVQLKVLKGSTEILAANFTGASFGSTSGYQYLYSTFKYEDTNVNKPNLSFQLHTHKVNNVTIDFDYVYISMIIPSVFP